MRSSKHQLVFGACSYHSLRCTSYVYSSRDIQLFEAIFEGRYTCKDRLVGEARVNTPSEYRNCRGRFFLHPEILFQPPSLPSLPSSTPSRIPTFRNTPKMTPGHYPTPDPVIGVEDDRSSISVSEVIPGASTSTPPNPLIGKRRNGLRPAW